MEETNDINLNISKKIDFLLQLSYFNKKFKGDGICSFSDYERYLGFNPSSFGRKDLRDLLKFLVKQDILLYYDSVAGVKRYKLHIKKLDKFLQKQDVFRKFYKYFDTKKTIIDF